MKVIIFRDEIWFHDILTIKHKKYYIVDVFILIRTHTVKNILFILPFLFYYERIIFFYTKEKKLPADYHNEWESYGSGWRNKSNELFKKLIRKAIYWQMIVFGMHLSEIWRIKKKIKKQQDFKKLSLTFWKFRNLTVSKILKFGFLNIPKMASKI